MNTTAWFEELKNSGKRQSMPIMTHPGIELLNKKVIDAVTDGQVHYEAVGKLNERFPQSAACTTVMDLTVEAEAFGCDIHFADDEVPSVTGRLLSDYAQVEALQIPTLDKGRIKEYLKADELAAKNIDKPVFAGCIGPFSLAGRLYDMSELMMAMYTEPETADLLLEKCTEFLTTYCKAIKATGVAGVIMAEPAAGLLPNEDCLNYSSKYVKKIIGEVQSDDFAVILHNCGNTGQCTEAMFEAGAAAYHFGNAIDMGPVLASAPKDVFIMGNIDPVGVFKMGTEEDIRNAVNNLLDLARGNDRFIISSGCDTPPEVPFGNIEAFYDAVEKFK